MRKRIIAAALFALLASAAFSGKPPMLGWEFTESVTLGGRFFPAYDTVLYAEPWREQDGYAIVDDRRLHYWLYDTYTYHGGDGVAIAEETVPRWAEDMGCAVDFDNIYTRENNTDLASSAAMLMATRKCDMSVTLVARGDRGRGDYIALNDYDKEAGIYNTTLYPLVKR